MIKYKFSGHETFQCRHFWLKKGYDFVQSGAPFKSDEALIQLGVGKNMISSISHWLKVFKVTDIEGEITRFGNYMFADNGKDPYLEDLGSLFLLHFNILNNIEMASIYKLALIDFRRTRISSDFTADQLFEYTTKRLSREGVAFSDKSLKNDIKVFLRTYLSSSRDAKSIEDDFSSVLLGLDMVAPVQNVFIDNEQVFSIAYNEKRDLDALLFLYAILETFEGQTSISFDQIQEKVSELFLCNNEGTDQKLIELHDSNYLVYLQDAGRKEVQFKETLDKFKILDMYYDGV